MRGQRANSATPALTRHAETAPRVVCLLRLTRWTSSATVHWATETDCASLPPKTCALAHRAETEAPANSPASIITSVNAHQGGQVKTASKQILVPQTHVPTAVSAVPLSPTSSVTARLSSRAKRASKTSTSAPRIPRPAGTVELVKTRWGRTGAAARPSTRGDIARPSISPATPHRASMGAPAYRRATPTMSVPVCQVSVVRTVRRI